MNYELDSEEQEILNAFENGKLKSVHDAEQKLREAREAARNTLDRMRQVRLSLTEKEFKELRIAEAEFEAGETISFDDVREKWLKGESIDVQA
jgi:hypothetical protein